MINDMKLDMVLPISLFAFLAVIIFVYHRFKDRLKTLFGGAKVGKRDVVFLVLVIGVMVTILALIPSLAVQVLYIAIFSYTLLSFTFMFSRKWYIAVLPPILFVLSYFFFWNLLTFNVLAFTIASIIIIQFSNLFTWKTTVIFAGLLMLVDVTQVFLTGLMGQLAEKAVFELGLPVVIMLPTYPTMGRIILGLGDIFLSGLLSLQNLFEKGRISGLLTAATIGIAMFIFEIVEFNTEYFTFFPATIVVLSGWLAGTGITKLIEKEK